MRGREGKMVAQLMRARGSDVEKSDVQHSITRWPGGSLR